MPPLPAPGLAPLCQSLPFQPCPARPGHLPSMPPSPPALLDLWLQGRLTEPAGLTAPTLPPRSALSQLPPCPSWHPGYCLLSAQTPGPSWAFIPGSSLLPVPTCGWQAFGSGQLNSRLLLLSSRPTDPVDILIYFYCHSHLFTLHESHRNACLGSIRAHSRYSARQAGPPSSPWEATSVSGGCRGG